MKYLYLFKNKSGVINVTTEETAYVLIYETEESKRQEFLGRVKADQHRTLQPASIRASREYRQALTSGNMELARAIEDSNITGQVSDVEADYYTKVSEFEKKLETEMLEKLVAMAEMVKPDESSNVSVPYGDRSSTLSLLKQMK